MNGSSLSGIQCASFQILILTTQLMRENPFLQGIWCYSCFFSRWILTMLVLSPIFRHCLNTWTCTYSNIKAITTFCFNLPLSQSIPAVAFWRESVIPVGIMFRLKNSVRKLVQHLKTSKRDSGFPRCWVDDLQQKYLVFWVLVSMSQPLSYRNQLSLLHSLEHTCCVKVIATTRNFGSRGGGLMWQEAGKFL